MLPRRQPADQTFKLTGGTAGSSLRPLRNASAFRHVRTPSGKAAGRSTRTLTRATAQSHSGDKVPGPARRGAPECAHQANCFPWERSAGVQAPYNLRYDHQTAAANTRHAPNGSGTQNAPSVASAAGDLIFRKLLQAPSADMVNAPG